MAGIKKRLPESKSIIPVYAIIAFMLFMWSFVLFAWNLPSWLNFMTPATLFAVFCYSVLTTFVQSLVFLLILLGICFILPPGFFRETFVVRGGLVAISLLGLLMLRSYLVGADLSGPADLPVFGAITVTVVILLAIASSRAAWLARSVAWLADRMIVFLYILIPLTVLSLVAVMVRNVA